MKLTTRKIETLTKRPKPYRVADGRGLCIEVSTTGSKLWRYRFRLNGLAQMAALGEYPLTTLAEARKRRDEAAKLVEAGQHPTQAKRAEKLRRALEGQNTFKKCTAAWFALKAAKGDEKSHKQNHRYFEKHIFPSLGPLTISSITTPEVVNILERICQRGTFEAASRARQMIGQVFRYAQQRGLIAHNPAADLRGLIPPRERRHHPCILLAELPTLLKAIHERELDFSRIAMDLLALTFVRTGELIGARWSEIDWDREEWAIPAERMKAKRPHTVPLSRQAISTLKELHAITGSREFLFFSAASKSKHLSNGTVLMALRRMGYAKRMSGHGFRTLASTILNENNFPPDHIEIQLAHADKDRVRSAYNAAQYLLPRKQMMQWYADFLDKVRTGDQSSVIPLQRATLRFVRD